MKAFTKPPAYGEYYGIKSGELMCLSGCWPMAEVRFSCCKKSGENTVQQSL